MKKIRKIRGITRTHWYTLCKASGFDYKSTFDKVWPRDVYVLECFEDTVLERFHENFNNGE